MAPRPNIDRYAPRVRVVDTVSGEPVPLTSRIVSARVVQKNTGVAQLTLKLANQRFESRGGVPGPTRPPWFFNDLEELRFGRRLRVDFGYVEPGRAEGEGGQSSDPTAWTGLILARITDLQFDFPADEGATVTVMGEDLLSLLAIRPTADKAYRDLHEWQIVGQLLADLDIPRLSLATVDTHPNFGDENTLGTKTHQRTQTYLEFVESLAKPLDYEVFVDFMDHDAPTMLVELHFERARSLGTGEPDDAVELQWERDFLHFTPRFQVWDQYSDAAARGSNPRRRERVDAAVDAGDADADHHVPDSDETPWLPAIDVRTRALQNEGVPTDNHLAVEITNLDRARATLLAQAKLREAARKFLTVETETIGRPELRAGRHIRAGGFGPPFDGIYYITTATHTFDDMGYRTALSLRRTGMRGAPRNQQQQGDTE